MSTSMNMDPGSRPATPAEGKPFVDPNKWPPCRPMPDGAMVAFEGLVRYSVRFVEQALPPRPEGWDGSLGDGAAADAADQFIGLLAYCARYNLDLGAEVRKKLEARRTAGAKP